jgi:hypothetical protein
MLVPRPVRAGKAPTLHFESLTKTFSVLFRGTKTIWNFTGKVAVSAKYCKMALEYWSLIRLGVTEPKVSLQPHLKVIKVGRSAGVHLQCLGNNILKQE